MSRSTAIIILSIVGLIGFMFTNAAKPSSQEKQISFIGENVMAKLRATSKLHSSLQLKIRPATDAEFQPNQSFGLIAELTTNVPVQNVSLVWAIPSEVTHISGDKEQSFAELQPGEIKTFEIVVSSRSSENSKVFAHVSLNQNGRPFRETAQYNTILQKEIDTAKAALAERTKDIIESQQRALKMYK